MAGEANKRVVFLFADTQIKQESFVEDISNLLNTYEVPNLLQPADLATTFENIRPRAKAAGMDGNKDQLYNFFLQEVLLPVHSCMYRALATDKVLHMPHWLDFVLVISHLSSMLARHAMIEMPHANLIHLAGVRNCHISTCGADLVGTVLHCEDETLQRNHSTALIKVMDSCLPAFHAQVKRNLHMVLSFSPVGGEFRERLRKFPSLVNCTTIDWFSEWPRDALHTVATQFLADLPSVDAKVRQTSF